MRAAEAIDHFPTEVSETKMQYDHFGIRRHQDRGTALTTLIESIEETGIVGHRHHRHHHRALIVPEMIFKHHQLDLVPQGEAFHRAVEVPTDRGSYDAMT